MMQREFGRVWEDDMWTVVLGRMGFRKKRFDTAKVIMADVQREYCTNIIMDSKEDRDIWYSKGTLDREIRGYVGEENFIPYEQRYDLTPAPPMPMTYGMDIRTMTYKDLAHFLATWEPKGEEEILKWLKQEVTDG